MREAMAEREGELRDQIMKLRQEKRDLEARLGGVDLQQMKVRSRELHGTCKHGCALLPCTACEMFTSCLSIVVQRGITSAASGVCITPCLSAHMNPFSCM